ncbi:MAG: hypothetical protein JW951_09175 [Lentisphaerae bacterium]|nr:hypothetical protein [Lentisphaerota bacterium]
MLRGADRWLPGYLASLARRPRETRVPRHLIIGIADHFEPFRGGPARCDARATVRRWTERYPASVSGLADADGRPPRHTFFYPAEEYDPECLALLAGLCPGQYGEVEIHLHHDNDTADGLRAALTACRDRLRRDHGLLGTWRRAAQNDVAFGFVHGNWALCNSRPDGRWCGVNEELGVLAGAGCYADFTFPSAPSPTQPRTVNALYRATDRPGRPRGHDRGRPCRVANAAAPQPAGRGFLLVQGPLALNWSRRKWGVLPRLDNAGLDAANPPSPRRADLWAGRHIHVRGRPEWVFVKLHTHGCVPANAGVLLGEPMRRLHAHLQTVYNDGRTWRLHYATAREIYNMIRAAEDGRSGNPGDYRDYEISPPPAAGTPATPSGPGRSSRTP